MALCAAMGVTAGDATAKMRVLDHSRSGGTSSAAKKMVAEGRGRRTRAMFTACWSNPVLETDSDTVRVLTLQSHTNIVRVDHAPFEASRKMRTAARRATPSATASRLIDCVCEGSSLGGAALFADGIDMNMAVAQEASEFGLGQKWPICSSGRERLRLSGFTRKKLCAAASYAEDEAASSCR